MAAPSVASGEGLCSIGGASEVREGSVEQQGRCAARAGRAGGGGEGRVSDCRGWLSSRTTPQAVPRGRREPYI